MKKIISLSLIFFFLIQANPVIAKGSLVIKEPDPPILNILNSNKDEFSFEFFVPDYKIETRNLITQTVQIINVPGLSYYETSDGITLPVKHILLGVPSQVSIELNIIEDEQKPLGSQLSLDEKPSLLSSTPSTGSLNLVGLPVSPVQIGEDAWLRDQRIMRIDIFPFHYEADKNQLIWHQRLVVSVKFSGKELGDKQRRKDNPISPYEDIFKQALLNYEVARQWRGYPRSELGNYATSLPTVSLGPRYKILVDKDGIYKITYDDLLAAGMNVDQIDPTHLSMISQDKHIAIYINGEQDGHINPGDFILFYGQKYYGDIHAGRYAAENQNWLTYDMDLSDGTTVPWHPQNNALMLEKYTDENVYWLMETAQPGLRMDSINGDPSGNSDPIPLYDQSIVHAEKAVRYNSYSYTGEETWFWEWVQNTSTHIYTTTINTLALEPYTATVRGEVVAFSSSVNSPDHVVQFNLNNQTEPLLTASWEGQSRYHFEQNVPQSYLNNGVNQLKFRITGGFATPSIYFDWFEIEYLRPFAASQNQFDFVEDEGGTWRHQITGFTDPDVYIFDITHPFTPTQILTPTIGGSSTYTVSFRAIAQTDDHFILTASNALFSPKSLAFYNPPDLYNSQNGADYIFITHQLFFTKTLELANFRAAQNLRVKVIDITDLYNEFNDGIPNPIAIKNFLTYTFASWQPPLPMYVLLVGDGHWNIKGYNPSRYGTTRVFLPPYLAWVDLNQGEVDSTNLLATIVGSDPLPDLSIGRLPVNDINQEAAILNKIFAYEQSSIQDWQRNVLFIADNIPDSAGNFEASAEYLISTLSPGFQPLRIYTTEYCGPPGVPTRCPTVNRAITETINTTGTVLVSYIGHGALQRWAHEQIFVNANIASLTNENKYPVIFSLTCWDGYWEWPNTPSLMEEMLRTPQKGTVSTFSPSGLGVATGHDALADGFYSAIFRHGIWELGAVTIAAKLNLYMTGNNLDLINNYLILGDPALHILSPYRVSLQPQHLHQSGTVGTTISYTLTITNSSILTDTFELSVSNNTWTTTVPVNMAPLSGGDSTDVRVDVQIPRNAGANDTDSTTIIATSQGDHSKIATAVLTTTANVHGVTVAPLVNFRYAAPGETVTYTINITNTGNVTDSYDFLAYPGEYNWNILLPTSPITLAAGLSISQTVNIVIHPEAIDHQEEFTSVKVTSRIDPGTWVITWLRTMVSMVNFRIFIPNIVRE